MTRTKHRQSLLFGWKALVARKRAVLPAPRTPTDRQLEPWLVALLLLAPPAGLFAWWRTYRHQR
jgi:hypothetical protein